MRTTPKLLRMTGAPREAAPSRESWGNVAQSFFRQKVNLPSFLILLRHTAYGLRLSSLVDIITVDIFEFEGLQTSTWQADWWRKRPLIIGSEWFNDLRHQQLISILHMVFFYLPNGRLFMSVHTSIVELLVDVKERFGAVGVPKFREHLKGGCGTDRTTLFIYTDYVYIYIYIYIDIYISTPLLDISCTLPNPS